MIRNASVTASYPGMSTERVEDLITKPIESAMREIAEIDEITSTSKTGQTQVDLTIHDNGLTTLDAVFQDIRNKADDLGNELPSGTNGPFVDDEKGLTAIATIALWADGFSLALRCAMSLAMRAIVSTRSIRHQEGPADQHPGGADLSGIPAGQARRIRSEPAAGLRSVGRAEHHRAGWQYRRRRTQRADRADRRSRIHR